MPCARPHDLRHLGAGRHEVPVLGAIVHLDLGIDLPVHLADHREAGDHQLASRAHHRLAANSGRHACLGGHVAASEILAERHLDDPLDHPLGRGKLTHLCLHGAGIYR